MSTPEPDFAAILKQTMEGLNNEIVQARGDLNDVVAKVRDALVKSGPEDFTLFLHEVKSDSSGVVYSLVAECGDDQQILGYYQIGASGYPICLFFKPNLQDISHKFASKDELQQHFASMLRNPTSPLIVFFAYELRKKQKEKGQTAA